MRNVTFSKVAGFSIIYWSTDRLFPKIFPKFYINVLSRAPVHNCFSCNVSFFKELGTMQYLQQLNLHMCLKVHESYARSEIASAFKNIRWKRWVLQIIVSLHTLIKYGVIIHFFWPLIAAFIYNFMFPSVGAHYELNLITSPCQKFWKITVTGKVNR